MRIRSARRPKSCSLHSDQTLAASIAIPAFVLGREKQDAGYSESEFQGKTLSEEAVKAFLIASFLSQNRKSEPSGYGRWI